MRKIRAAFFGSLLTVSAHAQTLDPVSFDQLPGWNGETIGEALDAFRISCAKPLKSKGDIRPDKEAWQKACSEAATSQSPQAFFERYFTPYRMRKTDGEAGFVTGYYIPLLKASLTPDETYRWPVYRVPDDFSTPYLTRAQIEAGALKDKGYEIAWLADPVMRFFLHVQGSGHIELPDGRRMTLQYAAKNERPYTAIGKVLLEEEALQPGSVSLQTIRDYLRANPQRQREIFNHNESYVFFSLNTSHAMPKGGQGVPLTPEHSLAVDKGLMPYGLPVLVDVKTEQPFQRLLITQDTGSAIKGALRGDIFFGLGEKAERKAGGLADTADWYLLLPKADE